MNVGAFDKSKKQQALQKINFFIFNYLSQKPSSTTWF
jgi:hypothetical protein